ncbi:hypothetical protein [Priestia megaterium]|uniref:hypothetical protein n=1 Tax=Priestia megaterium TaxID=1404 RepID=UPI00159BC7E2|nr:hypothetical protein [Priestia megaterium]
MEITLTVSELIIFTLVVAFTIILGISTAYVSFAKWKEKRALRLENKGVIESELLRN